MQLPERVEWRLAAWPGPAEPPPQGDIAAQRGTGSTMSGAGLSPAPLIRALLNLAFALFLDLVGLEHRAVIDGLGPSTAIECGHCRFFLVLLVLGRVSGIG